MSASIEHKIAVAGKIVELGDYRDNLDVNLKRIDDLRKEHISNNRRGISLSCNGIRWGADENDLKSPTSDSRPELYEAVGKATAIIREALQAELDRITKEIESYVIAKEA